MRIEVQDPIVQQRGSLLINHLRANVGHATTPGLDRPVIEHRGIGIAGRDDFRVAQVKGALRRTGADGLRFGQGILLPKLDAGRAAGPELVAVRAIDLQIRSSTAIQIGRWVVGRGQGNYRPAVAIERLLRAVDRPLHER